MQNKIKNIKKYSLNYISKGFKYIKKHKRKIFWSILILIILSIFFSGTYLFGLLQLITKGDVLISIEPVEKFILTNKRESQNISFNVKIENRFACSASCNYTFKDLSDNLIIDQGSFTGIAGTELLKDYVITPPKKGTGQKPYEFYVQCQNKEEVFCFSRQGEKVKSSFITLGYELSNEERIFMDETKGNLINYLNELNLLDQKIQELTQIGLSYQPFFFNSDIKLYVNEVNKSIFYLINESEELKQLWQGEEILKLNDSLIVFNNKLEGINKTVEPLNNLIVMNVNEYNSTKKIIEEYKLLLNQIDLISQSSVMANQNIKVKLLLVDPFVEIIHDFNTNKNLNETKQNVTNLKKQFININNKLIEEIKQIITMGDTLINSTLSNSINSNLSELDLNQSIDSFTNICQDFSKQINPSEEEQLYYNSNCFFIQAEKINLSIINFPLNSLPEVNLSLISRVSSEIYINNPLCCIFGKCEACCIDSCTNKKELYPLILLHGHAISLQSSISYSLAGFDKIRKKLEQDGFIDAGTIIPTENINLNSIGYLGRFGKPLVVGTTYYLDAYDEDGVFVSVPSKSESIKTYAKRLNQTIELIKHKTGSDKVNLIGYSMGGIVARQYLIDFGEDSVNKLILIGTPNKGISGTIESFCPVIGSKKECLEMASTSSFMNTLNQPKNNPKHVKVYTFVGKGCNMNGKDGDGVVLSENVELPYSLNFEIQGQCSSSKLLHQELRSINKFPKVYDTIKIILSQ